MACKSDRKLKADCSFNSRVTLELMERALDATSEGFTISDALLPDQPIIYVNQGFELLTGYSAEEILGRNCRFLQGDDTEPETVQQIGEAIKSDRPCSVEILNHRKNGEPFWNRLSITPVKNDEGATTHFIGIQTDITEKKEAEAALARAKIGLEKANLRMKKDLEAAARIQKDMLPKSTPEIPGYAFAWYHEPCDELAGDTLDIVQLDERRIALYTLDVSGHGVPGALLSAALSHWLSPKPDQDTILEAVPGESFRAPVQPELVASRLNSLFPMNLDHPQYFTLGYGILDFQTHELVYASAGHPPAVLVTREGEIHQLDSTGPPIGLLTDSSFSQKQITLAPGDRIFIYTDGLTEATGPDGQEHGFERLCGTALASRKTSLEQSLRDVVEALHTWIGGANPKDDVSILAFERSISQESRRTAIPPRFRGRQEHRD